MKYLIIGWLSWIAFVIFVVILSSSSYANDVLVSRDKKVHLFDTPCETPSILLRVTDEHQRELRAATLVFEGHLFKACWVVGNHGMVFLLDEEGDVSRIPVDQFLPVRVM